VVATTDIEAGAGGNANIDESSTSGNTRTVVIDYKKGTDLIEISGTSVVPEFGAISAIVLAIAIVGIIMATARFGNKFNFMRQ
jgi:predicted secreted protein with PEFG-CTERM motif